ncbi:MAG: cysteine desulfurase family protein [Candidatus Caenarcaniphilales bacterium]|nr:cysteine desulfurase family protein [Candidatus Caenarcaniphilales bacterium]
MKDEMQNIVYCDNAASTKTRPEVIQAMLPVFEEDYGNASSLHNLGRRAKKLMSTARKQCAVLLNCLPEEIHFTSGGTESNNIAIHGTVARAIQGGIEKKHIVSCITEHSAVYQPLQQLIKEGFEVTFLPVDSEGFIDFDRLKSSLREDTFLVSIMHANNEIGTIQDIGRIGELCSARGITFHSDAVQSAGKIPIDLQKQKVDLLSISGHKIYGPKGIGLIYIRKGLKLDPLLYGGTQEGGFKPGTENLPGIVGLGKAVELRLGELDQDRQRLYRYQRQICEGLEGIQGLIPNGPKDLNSRVPGLLNYSFEQQAGEAVVLQLDLKGICASSGSACSEGSIEPSRVIEALYPTSRKLAFNSLRISLGHFNQDSEIPRIIEAIRAIASRANIKSDQALKVA